MIYKECKFHVNKRPRPRPPQQERKLDVEYHLLTQPWTNTAVVDGMAVGEQSIILPLEHTKIQSNLKFHPLEGPWLQGAAMLPVCAPPYNTCIYTEGEAASVVGRNYMCKLWPATAWCGMSN